MSMYTTAQLLAANEKKFKFDPLFLRLFFRESYPFTTEKVYLSQIPGLVNMALYVSPIVSGEVIRSRGGSTSEFTPGYVKPKHEVNPQMTLRRLPDEDPQNLADPAYRRRRIIMQNMRDEELAIAQVEEMQAVSAVLKGKYTMTGEAFDPVEVDMGRSAANNITQSGGTEWSKRDKSTYDPTDDIEAYALNASGVVNIIVFDPKGWALFRSFKAVKEKLDTRRGSNSELETAVKDLGEAVSYKGMYGDTAIVVYSGQYVENDVKKNFLPDNTMVLGNTQARGLRTLWVYKGSGDPYANPLSDVDWSRLAKVKDLTPGELTAESYDDSYLDDKDADWTATGQGQKSAGDTSFTLAWMPGEQGQQALLAWFNEGDTRAYKIRFPNGTVDVFRGWVSSIGKAVTAKEVITRTVKVTNVGRPSMAEDRSTVTAATGMTVTPASTSVVKGQSTTLTVAFQPEGATDKSFRAVSADKTKATVSVSGMTITVKGVAAGKVNIPVVSGNGELAVVAEITVTDS
ncbi:phage major capsid protein [Escherichia coli]|nr:phage major capsid protein [Escherichia coli]